MNRTLLAVLCADLHLRDKPPTNRIDDYWEAQWRKLEFIRRLAGNVPILIAGDLLDKWNCSNHLIGKCMDMFGYHKVITIYGQHEQPFHSMNLINKSGLYILNQMDNFNAIVADIEYDSIGCFSEENDFIKVIGYHWGSLPTEPVNIDGIVMLHELVFKEKDKPAWTKFTNQGYSSDEIFDLFPNAKLIVSGDHHASFTHKRGAQLLVNPGSMMRMNTDQLKHKPSVYLWYADNTVERVYLPIEDNVFDLSDAGKIKDRDNRIAEYAEKQRKSANITLSFTDNLEAYMKQNKTNKHVKEIIRGVIEDG